MLLGEADDEATRFGFELDLKDRFDFTGGADVDGNVPPRDDGFL